MGHALALVRKWLQMLRLQQQVGLALLLVPDVLSQLVVPGVVSAAIAIVGPHVRPHVVSARAVLSYAFYAHLQN